LIILGEQRNLGAAAKDQALRICVERGEEFWLPREVEGARGKQGRIGEGVFQEGSALVRQWEGKHRISHSGTMPPVELARHV